ncbi:MAG: hypothetical protein ACI3ZP_10515 [Candidatus Cryptobacteroides sp.]
MNAYSHDTKQKITATCTALSLFGNKDPGGEPEDPLPPHFPEVLPSLLFPSAFCRAVNRFGRQSLSPLERFRVITPNAEAFEARVLGDTPSGKCFPAFLHICFQARCGQLMLWGRVPATRCPDTRRSLAASVSKPLAALSDRETRYLPSTGDDQQDIQPRASLPRRLPPPEAKNGRERFPAELLIHKTKIIMTREVIYHLLEEAAESGRHYQESLMAARRTASLQGGCEEFKLIGDALMEADNVIAALEEMLGRRTSPADCLREAEEFIKALHELRCRTEGVVDGYQQRTINEAVGQAEWSLDLVRCASRGRTRRGRKPKERGED